MTTLWDDFDLAAHLGLRPSWVAERGRKGLIPCIKLGRYRRYDPASEEFKAWLDKQRVSVYDAVQSEKSGPYMEDQNMVRSSYQRGSVRRRKRKHGIVYELRYRIKNGTNTDGSTRWLEKTEELRNNKGQLCK